MIIVHFIATNFIGGPEKQILNHMSRLKGTNITPLLVSFNECGGQILKDEALKIGVSCELLPIGKFRFFSVYKKLKNILDTNKVDILCAHGFKALFYAILFKVTSGKKIIAFSRGWTNENFKIVVYTVIDKILIRFATRIVAVSSSQKLKLKKIGVNENKIVTVRNALTFGPESKKRIVNATLKSELSIDNSSTLFFTAGRLSPEKGHIYLIEAFNKLYKKDENVHLLIAGSGPSEKELTTIISSMRCKNNVHFLGFRDDIKSLYRQVDIFILPSLSEGLPNVVLEAMAYELPVISTAVGGVPEIIENMRNGLLINSASTSEMERAMFTLLTDKHLRKELANTAKIRVNKNFDPEIQTNKLTKLYHEVAANG